jgi:hypothetical protein
MVNVGCRHSWRLRDSNVMVFFVIYMSRGARGAFLSAAGSCCGMFNFFDASKYIYAAVDGIYICGELGLVGCQYLEGFQHVFHDSSLICRWFSHGFVKRSYIRKDTIIVGRAAGRMKS